MKYMKKALIAVLLLIMVLGIPGCGAKKESNNEIIGGADHSTAIILEPDADEEKKMEQMEEEAEGNDHADDTSSDQNQFLAGTWVTGSMGYEYYGTPQAEYYVKFTDTEISYGHMKDDAFILDHSDRITSLENLSTGGCMVKAETAGGGQYTYRTDKNDDNVLNCYETWNEDDFPKQYRAGASLSRIGK